MLPPFARLVPAGSATSPIHTGLAPGSITAGHARSCRCRPDDNPARIRRLPPAAPASAAAESSASAASPRDAAPPKAVDLRLLNRSLRGTFARFPGRAVFCLWRQGTPAHAPPGHRPHSPGPGTIKSWHLFFTSVVTYYSYAHNIINISIGASSAMTIIRP